MKGGDTMKDRITEVRKTLKFNQEEFAKSLNLSRNFINQLECGKKNASDRTILDICRLFKVNEYWLRTGQGEMFIQPSMEEEIADFTADLFLDQTDSFKKRLVSALAQLTPEQWDTLEEVFEKINSMKKE